MAIDRRAGEAGEGGGRGAEAVEGNPRPGPQAREGDGPGAATGCGPGLKRKAPQPRGFCFSCSFPRCSPRAAPSDPLSASRSPTRRDPTATASPARPPGPARRSATGDVAHRGPRTVVEFDVADELRAVFRQPRPFLADRFARRSGDDALP